MKKKIFLMLTVALMLSCLFVLSVSAEVTTYDDAPERVNIQISTNDVVVFDDGFTCPSAYIFKDVNTLNDNTALSTVCDFEYINGKLGKEYTFANVEALDIPEGFKYLGRYACKDVTTLKRISLPNSIVGWGNAIFQGATGLEYCVMEFTESNPLKVFPSYMFTGCSNLKAFSMPDCFTSIDDVYTFTNCKKMTAVYLSKNLITWQSGGGGSGGGTFDYCNKMYFVNEPFTGTAIPEKPEVYYFPTNLEITASSKDFSKNSTMRDCSNLNNVLVFGPKVTSMTNEYFFQGGPQNKVVFLADMVEVRTGKYWGTTTFYFANPNDLSLEDLTFTVYNNVTKATYFCNAEGNTNHLAEKAVDVEAKCEVNAGKITYCFCGNEMSRVEVEGTALSHDYDYLSNENAKLVSITYANYAKEGTKTVSCALCSQNGEFTVPALFVCRGYSAPLNGSGSVTLGFAINSDAISDFTRDTGKTLEYGVFAVLQARLGDNNVLNADGTESSGVIKADVSKIGFDFFEIKITGFETDDQKDAKIAMGAYVIASKEETKEISYIQESEALENENYYFASYNDIINK